jgi:hypothetical protein
MTIASLTYFPPSPIENLMENPSGGGSYQAEISLEQAIEITGGVVAAPRESVNSQIAITGAPAIGGP